MGIQSTTGMKLFIGGQVDGNQTQTEFEAITWEQIKPCDNFSALSSTSNEVTFNDIGAGEVRKLKGQRQFNDVTFTGAYDGEEAGQDALALADKSQRQYAWKFVGGDDEGTSPTTVYFVGPLKEFTSFGGGNSDEVLTMGGTIAVNYDPVIVKAVA